MGDRSLPEDRLDDAVARHPRLDRAILLLAIFLFAVFFPAAALGYECWSGWFGSAFFEIARPLPLALFGLLAPLSNLVVLLFLVNESAVPKAVRALSGLALGVAGVYAIAFLRVLPFAIFGILMLGTHLVGFIPLAALWTTWRLGRRLPPSTAYWKGVWLTLPLFLLASAPNLAVWTGLRLAQSIEHHDTGIAILRNSPDRLDMLRAGCPGALSIADVWTLPLQWIAPVSQRIARESFQLSSGVPFDAAARATAPARCLSSKGALKEPAN